MRSGSFNEVVAQLFLGPILRVAGLFEGKKYRAFLAKETKRRSGSGTKETDRLINPTDDTRL